TVFGIPLPFSNSAPAQIGLQILIPMICVSNTCLGVTNGFVTFSGCVTNCGNALLTNVFVTNFVNGAFSYVLGPLTLDTNQFVKFTRTYPAADPCLCSTLSARGTDSLGLTVSNSATAACTISAVGDFVWRDDNMDGIQQTNAPQNEPGVGGVLVKLMDCSGNVLRMTNTAA